MIIINSVSNTLFSFNGIEYFRNYISVVRGERIEIFNCYERDDVMLPLTHYSEVSLNGITYSNATDLQSVLQTVIYSRATLGSDEVEVVEQNNIGKVIYLDYVSGSDLLTQVLGDINSQTTLISATDNPVFFTAYKSASTASVAQKLRFQFMGGKGTWGAGGNAVLPSHLYQLPPESLLPEDITTNSKSNVISLGQVTNEPEFLTKVNSSVRDLTDTSKLHYFSYSLDSVLYLKRFTGQPGEYDGTQTVLTETDFNDATNSNVQLGLYLPTLKDITAVDSFTDTPITVTDNNTGDNITFSGSSIKHTSVNGDTTTLDYQPNTEDVTYSIPAKSTDDVFAMQSDVNGITIVSNQSASELYLKNVDGTTLATINLGFLNNEGTTFFYNETSEKLELKNDDGEVLSEVPVSAFVANLMQSVDFNGATPQTLEFKDAEGNVVDSVTFTVSNILGLQNALDDKISTSHLANDITSVNLTDWQKAFTDYVSRRESSPVTPEVFNGDMNTMNKGTYMTTMSTTATNKPFLDVGGLISVGSATLGFQILGSRTGNELWFRPYTSTYGSWYRLWNSEDFTLTGELRASEDLNTYTETGIYTQDSNADASGGTNYPTPYAGILKVFRKGDFIWQTYHSYSLQNEVFHRGRNSSGSWVSWVRSWDTSDFSQSNITNWNTAYNRGDFKDFGHGSGLASNTALENDILVFSTTGVFRVASTAINLPEADNGFIYRMYRGGSNAYVVFYSDSGNIFKNVKDGSSWSGWEKILTSLDITIDGSIGDAQNLNNFTKTGNYSQTLNAQAATGLNYPVPNAGMLEVFSNNITSGGGIKVYQKYHSYNNEVYIRGNSAGIWSSWSKITKSSDLSGYLPKSGDTMTGAIKYGSPTQNQTSFIGTKLAGTEIGYTAWMLQNLDWDAVNSKFTKPRANLISLALGLGTGNKALRLMYAPNAITNGDDADLSTVFSVDSQGRIITQEHGTSENWNTAYNRGDFRDYGLGKVGVASYPKTDLNDTTVENGFYSVPNTILNIPVSSSGTLIIERYSSGTAYITQKFHAISSTETVRLYIRHYRAPSGTWSPWRQIWTDENFSPDDKAEVNDTLSFKGIIPSNDDINNYTVNGFYSTESSTTANLPVEDKGILTVTSNGNDHSQTYTNYNSNEFYFRTSSPSGGGWNSWERVAKSSERVINNTLTSPPTAASLNSLYPSVNATFTVIAPNVEKGNMYVKTDNGWLIFTGNTVF